MPGASTQLLQQQAAQQGLAIYEEGFLPCSSSSGSLFDHDLRSAAQQLLRQLRFLEPNPGRLLVSVSSRGWQAMLQQHAGQQHQLRVADGHMQHSRQQAAVSSSGSSSSTSEVLLPGFELSLQQAAAEGLVCPVAAVSIPVRGGLLPGHTPTGTGTSAAAAAGTAGDDPWLALCCQSSNSLISAAINTFSSGGKALAYTSSQVHARQLSVTLNLQGIGSLALHENQSPEDQAAVLAAFGDGPDRVLVSSLAGDAAAAAPLGCAVSCVLFVGPEAAAAAYAARLAPALLPAAAGAGNSSSGAGRCMVVDFVDAASTAAAAAAGQGGVPVPAAAHSPTCSDVLGSYCTRLPLPHELAALADGTSAAAAAAAAAAGQGEGASAAAAAASRRRRRRRSTPAPSAAAPPAAGSAPLTPPDSSSRVAAVRGDLIWTILGSGSWAIPLRRGRGANMTGLLVLWLTRRPRGWLPEVEAGLGQLAPLPGTTGRPLRSLQRARLLAEAWVKAHHPTDAQLREAGMDWRDRHMSEAQVVFCERHGIPYDPAWSRGTVNNTIDRYVVETMRLPATERQMFLARHMAPYAPAYFVHSSSTALMYRQAADNLLQALLTANFSRSTAQPSKAALQAEASAAAAAAAAAVSGVQQGSADTVGRDEVLPARKALMEDLELQFEAGLRPKHTWMVIRGDELLLDLMSGSYLWLKPVQPPPPPAAAAAAAGDNVSAPGHWDATAVGADSTAAGMGGTSRSAAAPAVLPAAPRRRGRPRKSSEEGPYSSTQHPLSASNGSSAAVTAAQRAAAAGKRLDPSTLYELLLELPDGSMHAVATPSTATALLAAHTASRTAAAAPDASSSSSSSCGSGRGAKPLPLTAALAKAERLAALLVTQQQAFLSREAAVRLAGMVGGWRVPSKGSEQQMAMPASPRQLELLRAAALPHSRRYSCLDAHRELLRYTKTHGLPEPTATPSQLARIRELRIPVSTADSAQPLTSATADSAGADMLVSAGGKVLTSAEAKAVLFRVQLAEEQREAERQKQRGGKGKGPVMGGLGLRPKRRT
ncbi:hypothetical protein COO60DRAFT_628552 [Scenedesmus sp. NREL 46B-D3]|nr:hypothetical protein COO60DRAFT_628552 [Scenedesmus sp. NREL 46B-D3]